MLEKIIEIAGKYADENAASEWNEDTFLLMELSSLEIYSFISEIEAVFGVHIKERDLSRIETLGDLQEIVEKGRKA
ncbi:MAG: acyl carrier protein [Lachnospiraceae bacterium]|nr:acyl carrier protein [Lachnospiraceae bacterium]